MLLKILQGLKKDVKSCIVMCVNNSVGVRATCVRIIMIPSG